MAEHDEHEHNHEGHEHEGHEHKHDHEGHDHEHDEDCDCEEHGHSHEGHEHDGHDHDHEGHEHEHKHAALANGEVQVNLHEEGALIASGSLNLVGADAEAVSAKLAQALADVARKVDDAGGLIGHLKATLAKTEVRMLSTTATNTEVSVKLSPQSEVQVNLVLIAFMVDEAELLRWGQEAMASLQG